MQLDPQVSMVLGALALVVGQLLKLTKWSPEGNAMRLVIVVIALIAGTAQVIGTAAVNPPPPMPQDFAQVVFIWIPQLLAWVGMASALVAGIAIGAYQLFVKGLGEALGRQLNLPVPELPPAEKPPAA